MMDEHFPQPRLVVSRCIGFDPVRYDGSMIHSEVIQKMKPFVDFFPVCPEVEIGLPVPRETLRIVRVGERDRLVQPATGRDLSEAMDAFSASFLASLKDIDGFILKNRSPSSGLYDVRVYPSAARGAPVGKTAGFFGKAVLSAFPGYPVEDEGRLRNERIRDHFFTTVFTLARYRQMEREGRISSLISFHSRAKYLLLSQDQNLARMMGNLVAHGGDTEPVGIYRRYRELLLLNLSVTPRATTHQNILEHSMGHFSRHLTHEEKRFFLESLERYRVGRIPLSVPKNLICSWIIRFGNDYMKDQYYFNPYPEALLFDSSRAV